MPFNIVRYTLDPTGANPNNLVVGDIYTLTTATVRAIAPQYGPFYSNSLVIKDTISGKILTTAQYSLAELLQDATMLFGQGVYCIILITDITVSNNISIQYQVVGGEYQNSAEGVVAAYQAAMSNASVVSWPAIIAKPVTFPPALHTHLLADVYGFGAIVSALERIRNAILLNGVPTLNAVVDWFANTINSEATARTAADAALNTAINSEILNRTNAINAEILNRTNAITAEATARVFEDGVLQTAIKSETLNRTNAINAEATARTVADGVLQAEITNLVNANANGFQGTATSTNVFTAATIASIYGTAVHNVYGKPIVVYLGASLSSWASVRILATVTLNNGTSFSVTVVDGVNTGGGMAHVCVGTLIVPTNASYTITATHDYSYGNYITQWVEVY